MANLVVDVGTSTVKAGAAGSLVPAAYFPTRVYRQKETDVWTGHAKVSSSKQDFAFTEQVSVSL